jgi:hypothetical protein
LRERTEDLTALLREHDVLQIGLNCKGVMCSNELGRNDEFYQLGLNSQCLIFDYTVPMTQLVNIELITGDILFDSCRKEKKKKKIQGAVQSSGVSGSILGKVVSIPRNISE